MSRRVMVISIDGVAPRFVDERSMPALLALGRTGASTFAARSIDPPITMPAHASMLRGVEPAVHGIFSNDDLIAAESPPSFLAVAKRHGRPTAAFLNWPPFHQLVEPQAADRRVAFGGGYDPTEDRALVDLAVATVRSSDPPAVSFVYLVAPDLAGHDHGWGSPNYVEALRASDAQLARLIDALDSETSLIVTTDHGGTGTNHGQGDDADRQIFMALRSPFVDPLTTWSDASLLDIAPTVAALAGFDPDPKWSGSSLVDRSRPVVDVLVETLAAMANESYGESVSMLEHSVQSAIAAQRSNAPDELVVASLLHDVGHLLGDAGQWGLPDHADVGATWLRPWLPAAVVEPIAGHVSAKRYLVATDPEYLGRLSPASVATLGQQGGAYTAEEAASFAQRPWAGDAIRLRRFDDSGKDPTSDERTDPASWRGLLNRVLGTWTPTPEWLIAACVCESCVDADSGQRKRPLDRSGVWRVDGRTADGFVLIDSGGECHTVRVSDQSTSDVPAIQEVEVSTDSGRAIVRTRADAPHLGALLEDHGILIATDAGSVPGTVLEIAARLGDIRETNYGRLFDVISKPQPENLAYTNAALALHSDNPYRDPVPRVQLLHCLKPAPSGGDSVFCDGFRAADQLRVEDPEGYETLCVTSVEFRYRSAAADVRSVRTVIERDGSGRVVAIALNHRSMQAARSGPGAERFLTALARFDAIVHAPENRITAPLGAGDVVIFDNRRWLHGRTGFDNRATRHLQGCYVDPHHSLRR